MVRSSLLGVLAVVAISILPWQSVSGQGFFRTVHGAGSGRFIEAPRAIEQQLREAERALAEQRYSDAVVRLGDLLARDRGRFDDSDLAGQDFFIGIDETVEGEPIHSSLLRSARDMIGELPTAAIETYELRYGPIARKMLSESALRRDWEKVREVRRKYFHTFAGYEASLLLAQRDLLTGHPLAASLLLDDVVRTPRAVAHLGAGIVVLHASSCSLAQRPLPPVSAIAGKEIVIGGVRATIPADSELAGWLAEHVGELDQYSMPEPRNYAIFGSQPNRNGSSAGQLPLTNLRWDLKTTASPLQERTLRKVADELATSGKLPPPSWMPLRVGDQLLMRTTERLVGVDYRTGKRVWTYPWQTAPETPGDEQISFDEISGEEGPGDLLSQRVWNDVPYGQVTSDGTRVFMLDDLGEVEMVSFSPMINMRGTRPADTSTNTLVALDLATEGKLLWRLGTGADEVSTLSNAFFLGPPLPLDGRLYVMVEIAGDINLCCLDPTSGAELWRQHLVAVESGGIEADPIRRVAGAMPTYHEGLLICPTGAGAVAVIDLSDRMLRWGVNYDRSTEMIRSINVRGRGIEASQLMQRWDTGMAVASDTTVLVTPIESDHLYGFDLLTGKPRFTDKNRVHMRYLAGIRDQRFYMVGASQVRAFDLETGNSIWTTPRDMMVAGQQIAGRGVFGKDSYFVPTTTNQLIQISLEDGSVLQRRNTRYQLGNLVAVDGEVIVQGPTTLSVAFGEATLEPIVNRMLEKNPDDFDAIVRKSELLIQRGKREEALTLLARARAMQPENVEVQMLSVSAMLGNLRDNLNIDPTLIESLDRLIDQPSQRAELLSLRVRAALSNRNYVEAVRRMIDFSSLLVSEATAETVSDEIVGDPSRQCMLDYWLAGRMGNIADLASEAEIEEINDLLRQAMARRLQGSTRVLERLLKHFRGFDGIEGVRAELIDRLKVNEDHLRLERLVLGTRIPTQADLANFSTDELLTLAEVYATGKLAEDAIAVLDVVASRDEAAFSERATLVRDAAESQIGKRVWPDQVALSWGSRQTRIRFAASTQRVAKTSVLAGAHFRGWQLISDANMPLALRDPTGLARVIPIPELQQHDEIDKESQICGGVMVVMMPSGLAAIDLYHLLVSDGEAVLWQRGLSGDGSPAIKRRSKPTPFGDQVIRYVASSGWSKVVPEYRLGPVLGDRMLLLQGGELMAIDLISRESMWRNSSAPKSGVVVSDGDQVAVVSSATSQTVFFDVRDGQRTQTQKWEHGAVWESIGNHVLCYQETGNKDEYELKLVDPFRGEVILRQTTLSANRSNVDAPSAYGRITDGRYLGLLQSDGQSLVWDLMEGREIGRPKLAAYPDLQGLHVLMLDGQIVFLPKRRIDRPRLPQSEQLQTADGSYHQTVHGVYAVSLDDGSLRWSKDFDKPWGCTLTQPAETPILMLTRSPFTYSIQSRKKYLDVLALDVRDGSEMSKTEGKQILSGNNELETRLTIQFGLSRVIAQIGPEMLTFKFGEGSDQESDSEAAEDLLE